MTDLKVGIISFEFPPFLIGGIGSHAYDLALSLSRTGVDTTVFAGQSKKPKIEHLNSNLKIVRLPFLDVSPKYLWFQLQNIKKMSNFFKEFDVLHGVHPLGASFSSRISKQMKKPFITTIHEDILTDLKTFVNSPISEWTFGDLSMHAIAYPLNEFLINTCLKNSSHVVVCGHSTMHDMMRSNRYMDPKKTSVIYNGINFEKIKNVNESPISEGFEIVFYGRLVSRKGILHLVKAVELLRKDFPEITLKIFGGGPLKQKIAALIEKMGLTGCVRLMSHVPYQELLDSIKRATIVALPSLYEVGPFIAALEAMAFKKPVVLFDFPFTREFVTDMKNGVLAKANDVNSLAEKIGLLLSDGTLRQTLGQNAYDYVKSKHDWSKLALSYKALYENVVSAQL